MGVSNDDTGTSTRRVLLAGAGAAGVVAALAGCGEHGGTAAPTAGAASTAAGAQAGGIKTADIPVQGGKIFPDVDADGVVVTQPAAGLFKAFSATCTHRGCTLTSVSDGTFNCPCHGARYSIADGSVVQPGDGEHTPTWPL